MAAVLEIQDVRAPVEAVQSWQSSAKARGEAWPKLRQGSKQIKQWLEIPRDPRGIVLACGFAGAGVLGLTALLSTGDPIGFAYLAIALVGYLFVQTRLVPTTLWFLIAAFGAWSALSGAAVDWVEAALGVVLAAISLLPPNLEAPRQPSSPATTNGSFEPAVNGSHVEPESAVQAPPAAAPSGLVLRCLGQFRVEAAGKDLAPALEDKAVLSFLFKFLLARWALGEPKVARTTLGDEIKPGVPESSQLERLRKQLYDLTRDIGPDLAVLVRSNRTHVWIDLSKVDSDLGRLGDLQAAARVEGDFLSSQLAREIDEFLTQSEGQEFLDGFEELEIRVNEGRGTAGQTIAAARLAIAEKRADLIRALAEYQDALGKPEAAIAFLRSGLQALPSRQDLARLLVTAYLKTGQTARAGEVRREFALAKE